ncbi:MAG: hypothetical protein A3K77_00585 [Euryarchaeota archaeon RBG_13_31_8]|nr:MAG: hypothetical protein A3K77_00585 [Euryarchaeota archaeon RBG_13_31_8]
MLRIACIGDYAVRYSYFTAGIMEGVIRTGNYFRPSSLFSTSIKELKAQIDYFQPHIIIAHQLFNNQYNTDEMKQLLVEIRQRGIKIVLHEGDPKSEPRFKEDISRYVDIGIINSKMINNYSNIWKIPCYNWPYFCLYQKEIVPADDKFKEQVSFSGNITRRDDVNHPHHGRCEFLEGLKKKIGLRIYPNEQVQNSRFLTPVISSSSNAIIGVHQGYDINGYLDTRPFQYIGTGALYFHDKCDAIEQFFKDGVHYVSYEKKNIESFLEKYKFYVVDYPEVGQKIRQEGFDYCQKHHNTIHRITNILEWLSVKKG